MNTILGCNIFQDLTSFQNKLKANKDSLRGSSNYDTFEKQLSHLKMKFYQLKDLAWTPQEKETIELARQALDRLTHKLQKYSGKGYPDFQKEDPQQSLARIADLLAQKRIIKAQEQFAKFEEVHKDIAQKVYASLWRLKGEPQNRGYDFGKYAFWDDQDCFSTSYEKSG